MHYPKVPLSLAKQIQKLRIRGLDVDNEPRAQSYLATIGYYRLSAYFLPFEDKSNTQVSHAFKPGTQFDDVLRLYAFDRKLRLMVMEALERIEVAVRALWGNALTLKTGQAHAYLQATHFKDPWKHQKNLGKVASDLSESRETFVIHYKGKYDNPFMPPTWMMAETLSFGALSHWFANTADNGVKKEVAKALGLPSVEIAESVLHCLTLVRNTCAHHSRLWNRQFAMALPYIKRLKDHLVMLQTTSEQGQIQRQPSKRLYNYLVVINHLMCNLQPASSWPVRLAQHLATLPAVFHPDLGLPNDWQQSPLWRPERPQPEAQP